MRSFGSRHIDARVVSDFLVLGAFQIKSREGRRENNEARDGIPIANTRHSLAEEGTLTSRTIEVRRTFKLAIHTTSYHDATNRSQLRIHELDSLNLRSEDNRFRLGPAEATGILHGIRDNDGPQRSTAPKRITVDTCQSIGQVDARE